MSDPAEYPTGVYVKGDRTAVAKNAARAVSLVFEGYRLVGDEPTGSGPDYRDLQEQAKELGINANQKASVLAEAIDAKLREEPSRDAVDPDAPATDDTDSGTDPDANIPTA